MRKVIIVIVLAALLLTGCEVPRNIDTNGNRMKVVLDNDCRIYIDRDSGVQYLSRGDSLCVMVDHDGKPLIANGWRDYD